MKQTLTNIMTAFIGESQARNRHSMFASTAKKGEHAKEYYKRKCEEY
jgi:rubrerythrin